jgi:hypothetical protein
MHRLSTAIASLLVAPVMGAPSNEVHQLLASNGVNDDQFGMAVAVNGTTAIVGAPGHNGNGMDSGSAYVFDMTTGLETFQLLPNDGSPNDRFGVSVAIGGTIAAVGTYELAGSRGSVYLFDTTTGMQTAKLVPNDPALGNDLFGYRIALSGTIALIGDALDDDNGPDSGSAYLFDTTTGQQLGKLLPSDGAPGDHFGLSVALSGTTAIVGAETDRDNGIASGSAYVFDITTGQVVAKLLASDGATNDRFGFSVAISGTTAVIGAVFSDDNGFHSGSAYIFDATTGQETAKLLPSDGRIADRFGASVAISGTTAIVGAPYHDDSGIHAGAAYLFNAATGLEVAELLPSGASAGDLFGLGVSLNGTTALVGAFLDNNVNGLKAGSASVFDTKLDGPFCDATDGALALCPCANVGDPETGCDIQQGTRGVGLNAVSQETFPQNRVTWSGYGFPAMSAPASVVIRAASLDPASPVVFGDGLRCIGVPFVRLGATLAGGGTVTHTHGHDSAAGSGNFHYQLWFRNTPITFCDPVLAFNLSSGRTLTW